MVVANLEGSVRLTTDTTTDTYEQAIAAVRAAYGLRPDNPAGWPQAPALEPQPWSPGPVPRT
ncbi:hypothetical protein [Streptomyces noursei]|uniref:hypothetical protein n=1 Tax=Streptomyces noursei TaxID=1971 RepID=UPI000A499044|nr:hypothetical protein [Streptomyces noursei]